MKFLGIQEQELEKQKLLFHQARLANRGVAEMVLLHISAAKGQPSDSVMKTLVLGISILRGGNVDVQAVSGAALKNNGIISVQMLSSLLICIMFVEHLVLFCVMLFKK